MSDEIDKRLDALEAAAAAIRDHIEAIRKSIATIDEALQRFKSPSPWRPPAEWPVTPPATGCVCPVGAEAMCGMPMCPRKSWGWAQKTGPG